MTHTTLRPIRRRVGTNWGLRCHAYAHCSPGSWGRFSFCSPLPRCTPTIPTTTADLVARVRGDIEGRRFIGDAGFGVRLRSGALVKVFGDTLVTATGNSDYPDAANQLPYVMRNSAT